MKLIAKPLNPMENSNCQTSPINRLFHAIQWKLFPWSYAKEKEREILLRNTGWEEIGQCDELCSVCTLGQLPLSQSLPQLRDFISATNLRGTGLPGTMRLVQKKYFQDDSDKVIVDEISSKIYPVTYIILRVSNLMFSHLVSNHRKVGFRSSLKGKYVGRSSGSLLLFCYYLAMVCNIFFHRDSVNHKMIRCKDFVQYEPEL